MTVSITDGSGNPRSGTVTLQLMPNYCGASLSGTTSVAAQNGVATFSNLRIDLLGSGYGLIASSGSATATSATFAITSAVTGETLTEETTLCITPTAQRDAAGLAYVPQDDALWLADDILPAVHGIARGSGALLKTIRRSEFEAAFPDAVCDDGDGNPSTSCSYFNEFEGVAYDRQGALLYVVNTVNNPVLDPPVDKPAIFRLIRNGASSFAFDAWQPLPEGIAYNAAVVVAGQLFLADIGTLYPYDFDANVLDTAAPALSVANRIHGLSYDGSEMWVLERTGVPSGSLSTILEIDWATGQELARHAMDAFGVPDLAGVEVVNGTILSIDGTPVNPIYVFTVSAGN